MPDRDALDADELDRLLHDLMIAAAMYPFRGPEVAAARAAVRKAARELAGEAACTCVGQHLCLDKDMALRKFDRLPERELTPEDFNRLLGFYRSGRGGEYDAAADTLNAHDAALRAERDALRAELKALAGYADAHLSHMEHELAVEGTPPSPAMAAARLILDREGA